jgi:beta-N-acetylhexosaminidase
VREVIKRVGQRFMVGFEGQAASPDVKALLREFQVGHVILFTRNVDRPEQVAELVRELQDVARQAGQELPLMVAVDQEGGRVARLGGDWSAWPAPRLLGRTGSEDLARRMGESLAEELAACGIRMDLAPVVDVDTNPRNPVIGDRSFGGDAELVGRMAAAQIRGLQAGGVAACAKHFPGHGDTDVDSHVELPVLDHPRPRLDDVELKPFRRALEAGVASVMTAHVLYRELDDVLPATLSPRLVGGLLRTELKFGGVVVADDMEMGAITRYRSVAEAAVLAVQAGCDVLPVSNSHDAQVAGIEAVIRAVEAEAVSWTSLDEADARIRRLKQRFVLPYRDPDPRQARLAAGGGQRQGLADAITLQAEG